MRRSEFEIHDQELITAFLQEQAYGVLGTHGTDGYPRLTPILFAYLPEEQAVYFHSSRKGEKVELLAACPLASFSVSEMHAMIPSYFTDPVYACPATTFFRSVHIRGQMSIVNDPDEKTRFFTAFMEKLQPEGGYEPFDWSLEGYAKQDAAILVYKLSISDITAKFKFGQNAGSSKREQIIEGLRNRQADSDMETLEWMEQLCPHRKSQS
ncbi:pyridoxamine 5'-phosphate oxidase family protein [Paenibacillus marinisediminis]